MLVCIDRSAIGSKRHLLCETDTGRAAFCDDHPVESWVLGADAEKHELVLDDLLALNGKHIDLAPPEKHVAPFREMMPSAFGSGTVPRLPWSLIMPGPEYRQHVSSVISSLSREVQDLSMEYYMSAFHETSGVLSCLMRACIDPVRYAAAVEQHHTVKSFKPDRQGFAQRVRYDRFRTRTGRMVVQRGPEILTLPREHRNIITSRMPGGRVVSMDYTSFEAQVARCLGGKEPRSDVYDDIINGVFHGEATRRTAKIVTLALLYGMGREALSGHTGLHGAELDRVMREVREYFGVDDLIQRLSADAANGFVTTAYGRKIFVDEPRNALNYFVQGTAVDAALFGFGRMMTEAPDAMVPLFVIHDSIVFDAGHENDETIERVARAGGSIRGLGDGFPVKIERL